MVGQKGFWGVADRLAEGDPQETLSATVGFEVFRPILLRALRPSVPSRLGRPPFCPVLKFRMLALQSLHGLSPERTAYMVRDRLRWMRVCGLGPGDRVPDVNALWDFREALIKATAKANARTSKARCHVEHVFAELKSRMGLVVRTIGIARAEAAIPLANMAFNMKRWVFLDARILPE